MLGISSIYSPAVNVMVMAIQKASKGLIRDFGEIEKLQASRKNFGNFVTTADKRSEDILLDELSKARPEYDIITEERGHVEALKPVSKFDRNAGFRWIIDPLDGTMNFWHGIPYFSISVALEQHNEIIAGVVYNPVTDEMFIAEKGKGAFLNRHRLRVSGRKNFESAIVATGSTFGFRGSKDAGKMLQYISEHVGCIRHFGANSLDLAFVAAGRIDCFFEMNLPIWDYAAGSILVTEAGGMANNINGNDKSLLASNEALHNELIKIISKTI